MKIPKQPIFIIQKQTKHILFDYVSAKLSSEEISHMYGHNNNMEPPNAVRNELGRHRYNS